MMTSTSGCAHERLLERVCFAALDEFFLVHVTQIATAARASDAAVSDERHCVAKTLMQHA